MLGAPQGPAERAGPQFTGLCTAPVTRVSGWNKCPTCSSLKFFLFFLPQGPPGLKGEQGDTVVIDYDGRILDALKVAFLVDPWRSFPEGISTHFAHLFTQGTRG